MSREDVEPVMGVPCSVKTTRTGRTRLEYGQTSPALVFVDDALVEINFLPEISDGLVLESLDGLDLMTSKEADLVAALRKRDDTAKERNGFLIFPRLGIALSGFEPPEGDQKAVTVFGPNHPWSTP
ncbi:hypothetical protein [Rhizobium sp.]|uniref:hypothetical protein n=1 Tax=Rhizobium sp. TaxID=391 RepID=UPI0028AB7F4A